MPTVFPIFRPSAVALEFAAARPALVLLEPDLIRVVIAHAHPVARAGFKATLQGEPDIGVAGTAGGGEEAVALIAELRPDVALVDLDLPGLGGLQTARLIRDDPHSADIHVVILATHDRDEDLLAALRAGARAFVLDSTEPAELVRAVRVVAGGDAFLSPSANWRLIAEFRSRPRPVATWA